MPTPTIHALRRAGKVFRTCRRRADRVVATDLLLTLLTCGAGVLAFSTGQGVYLGAMVVVAILGFLGTTLVARFIEGRGA